jgi:hypothetical protein
VPDELTAAADVRTYRDSETDAFLAYMTAIERRELCLEAGTTDPEALATCDATIADARDELARAVGAAEAARVDEYASAYLSELEIPADDEDLLYLRDEIARNTVARPTFLRWLRTGSWAAPRTTARSARRPGTRAQRARRRRRVATTARRRGPPREDDAPDPPAAEAA